jgi:hypothetical protein
MAERREEFKLEKEAADIGHIKESVIAALDAMSRFY